MATIESPVEGYDGTVVGVEFKDGKAETSDPAALAYFRRHGYTVGGRRDVAEPDPPIDAREATGQRVGTPLRDAAVDPRPGDYLPPTNAGQADPHGPKVIAPQVHGREVPKPIVPGPVPDDPDAQEAKETVATTTTSGTDLEEPAGNASTDEWRTYALSLDGVSEADVDGLSRNELRDRYGS